MKKLIPLALIGVREASGLDLEMQRSLFQFLLCMRNQAAVGKDGEDFLSYEK